MQSHQHLLINNKYVAESDVSTGTLSTGTAVKTPAEIPLSVQALSVLGVLSVGTGPNLVSMIEVTLPFLC